MSAGELVLPKDMATPSEVELKASGVDPQKIGMFFFVFFFDRIKNWYVLSFNVCSWMLKDASI